MSETTDKKCPKCGEQMELDMVDVGCCEIPSGPWGCPCCYYVEPEVELPISEEPSR